MKEQGGGDVPEGERGRTSMREVFGRVHRVETEVAEIREQLAGMNVNLQGQAAMLSRIVTSVESRGATDWKTLAMWATVILAIIGLVASLVLTPMRDQIAQTAASIGRLNDGRLLDGRNQLEDARRDIVEAQERGRYMERVDRLMHEVSQLPKATP